MPRRIALRLGVPYRRERQEVSCIVRKLIDDTSRTRESKAKVIEALQYAERWFLEDEHRLALEAQRGSPRGTSQAEEGQEGSSR